MAQYPRLKGPKAYPWRLTQRAGGQRIPAAVESDVLAQRLTRLAPSTRVEVKNAQRGPVHHLDLDPLEHRYLLAAAGDATIGLYDLDRHEVPDDDPDALPRVASLQVSQRGSAPVQGLPRSMAGRGGFHSSVGPAAMEGHKHSVTSVQWYPLDTGLFVTGSTDGTARVWDTNDFKVAGSFELGGKVHSVSLSPVMRTHTLLATGSDDRRVKLCDLTSGGSSHVLVGHSEAVMTVAWSPTDEFLLATGSKDQTVRLWDVRRSGASACLMSLDQHAEHVNRGRRRDPSFKADDNELVKAHHGWVVSVAFTPDGGWLLSAGMDKRMRLWNVQTGQNTLRNFVGTRSDKVLGWNLTTVQPGGSRTAHVLYPGGSSGEVLVYPVHTGDGRPIVTVHGHLDAVTSVVCRPNVPEIITAGVDSMMLVHDRSVYEAQESARLDREAEEERAGEGRQGISGTAGDAWSDDDEEDEGGEDGRAPKRQRFVPAIIQQLQRGTGGVDM